MKKKLLIIILSLFTVFAFSQEKAKASLSVKIDQVCSEDYPNMTAFVSVRNEKGEIVTGLAPGLFMTRIDSEELKGKQNVYPFSMKTEPVDYSILISNNGIMEGEPLDFQKTAVIKFIESMQKGETLSLYTIGDDAVPIFENLAKEDIDTSNFSMAKTETSRPSEPYSKISKEVNNENRKSVRKELQDIKEEMKDLKSKDKTVTKTKNKSKKDKVK